MILYKNTIGLDPELLELEITESVKIADTERTLESIIRLKEKGIRLAIDDFGTGYSRMSYPKQISADVIKIDRSFVKDLMTSKDDSVIVRTVIQMAHGLGMSTVVKGVEDEGTCMYLKFLSCHIVQGYFFFKPLPEAEFLAYCRDNSRQDVSQCRA